MTKINTVIIGAGKMGGIRYDSMISHGGYDITALCDISACNLARYNPAKYSEWEKCLDETKPEAVFVCTFNNIIPDIVCYALERGIHVFSEKPPGRGLRDALRMKNAAEKYKKILKFGFNHRYHNSIIEAKTLIDSKLLGDPVCARGVYGKAGSIAFADEWRNKPDISGGGILLDQGIHMLDLMCWFLGGDFTAVSGSVNKLVWNEIPTEDSAFAILKTTDGKVASLHSSAVQWKHKFDLDIVLTEGYIALNGLLTSTKSYGEECVSWYRKDLEMNTGKIGNPVEHTMCFDTDSSWDYEAAEFYDCVRGGKTLLNGTPDDAVRVMGLIEDIYGRLVS